MTRALTLRAVFVYRQRMRAGSWAFGGCLVLVLGCGDSGRTSASAAVSASTSPGDTTHGDAPTTTGGATAGQSASDSQATMGAVSTSLEPTTEPTTSTTAQSSASTTDASATTMTGATESSGDTTDGTTGEAPCVIADVPDTLAFTYSKSIDLAPINTIQASFYNQDDKEIVFFSYFGQGRRYSLDGTPLGDVMAPPEALPALDGATFDQVNRVGMLINQACTIVEVDPVTIAPLASIQLDVAKYGLQTCSGIAIGLDGHMYVNSFFTDEIVVLTRDGQNEIRRIDLQPVGLPRPDGITLIAGSANFLILSTTDIRSGILGSDDTVIVGPSPTGQDAPPLVGGNITNPDAVLTVCGNGHAWVCDEYGTGCHDYVPNDGDKDACACTIPQ